MPIRLFSGLPGAGKTLALVDQLVRFRENEPHRAVYAFGINGLAPGLALPCDPKVEPVVNPAAGEPGEPPMLPWWGQLPRGSIICIDEAQEVWPSAGLTRAVPLDMALLNRHRHWGYDFLLTTQKPSYLHAHVRGLVDEHSHFVRKWGGLRVDRYVWQEGVEDVKSTSMRSRAHKQKWKYPKHCFSLYKSSTMHTVKSRKPWFVYALPFFFLAAIVLGWYGVHRAKHIGDAALPSSAWAVRDSGGLVSSSATGSADRRVRFASVADYVKAFTPRIAGQPWSAPAYDADSFRSRPDLFCMEYESPAAHGQKICECYTEQVTRYHLPVPECRRVAREGQYNPHRPSFDREAGRDGDRGKQEPVAERSGARGDAAPVMSGQPLAGGGARVGGVYDPSVFGPHGF